jgi:hypothetical protein
VAALDAHAHAHAPRSRLPWSELPQIALITVRGGEASNLLER